MRRLIFALPILLALFSCGKRPIRIMVDPWMRGRVEPLLDSIGNPWNGHSLEVRYRSTEVAAEFIQQGEPIDLWVYAFANSLLTEDWPQYGGGSVLEDYAVRVRCPEHPDRKSWQTESCLAFPAAERPLGRMARNWLGDPPADSCLLIANFPHQLMAYAKRGWAPEAILYESAARDFHLKVLDRSEEPIYWVVGCRHDEFSPQARKEVLNLAFVLEKRLRIGSN